MKKEKMVLFIGLAFLLLVSLGKLANIYGELLWFDTLKFSSVFWTIINAKVILGLIFGLIFFCIIGINIYLARKMGPAKSQWELALRGQGQKTHQIIPIKPEYVNKILLVVCLVLSLLMGIWPAMMKWDDFLRFFYQTPFTLVDPIFQKNIGFYVFSYPVYVFIQKWLFYALLLITFLVGFIYVKDKAMKLKIGDLMFTRRAKSHLSILVGFILLLIAWERRLKMLALLYSPRGVAFGASYTDMRAQVVAYWIIIIIAAVCAFIFWINISSKGWKWPLIGIATLFALSVLVSGFFPWALQKFVVEPNELTKERPYIQNNIHYTRLGYNLDQIEEKDFQVSKNLNFEKIQKNSLTIKNVKLWDKNPLRQTYSELQEMRLYYHFVSVDEDRYTLDGEKTQIMLSARELDQSNLPPQAQTWENKHFKYTHGYGLCMSPVNHVTEKGLPNLIIKDIPPVSSQGSFIINRPEIYYGELGNEFVIVNTATQEFDYPKGDKNVYTNYEGKGGVPIGSFLNRVIFSLKYSDAKIFLTNYITPESRIMLHRQIKDRVKSVAPFLTYDRDPYVVLNDDGHIYWIQDAYTTTDKFPYSERIAFSLDPGAVQTPLKLFAGQRLGPKKINYIRNSVKVVINAYNGKMTYYVIDEADPIIKTYQKIFPKFFKSFNEMPQSIRDHVRYPRDPFEIQANMYRTYHMRDAQVFYNKEDLWDLPMQKSLSTQSEYPMKGYYIIMRLPDREEEEFLLMVPFTPNNKSNMIAWMSAQCDGPDYGRLLVYKFPKEKLIYGPRQVHARINQQTDISSELTLWSQQGSEVIRGELLVIPIEESILYIEPVYLMATDESSLPELKRVIVAYGDKIEMQHTLADSLNVIFGKGLAEASSILVESDRGQIPLKGRSINELAQRANQYFESALESLRTGDWAQYGQYQGLLQQAIQELMRESEEQ